LAESHEKAEEHEDQQTRLLHGYGYLTFCKLRGSSSSSSSSSRVAAGMEQITEPVSRHYQGMDNGDKHRCA
jgi:hypothetical protein